MTIGIIGAGSIGTALARHLTRAGLPAILANHRGPDSLAELVADIGAPVRAGTREEAAAQDMVIVAVNWPRLPDALGGLPDFGGRIVIDANNPLVPPDFQPADLRGRLSSEVFTDYAPGARVVKAFNHLAAAVLAADPKVAALINRVGFSAIDLGPLTEGGRAMSVPGGGLTTQNLVRFD